MQRGVKTVFFCILHLNVMWASPLSDLDMVMSQKKIEKKLNNLNGSIIDLKPMLIFGFSL